MSAKAGLKLLSVSIKYLPASPSPSSTSLRYFPSEESASHSQPECLDGWGGTGYQILTSSSNYWLLSQLPPSKSQPDPGQQSAGDKAYERKVEVDQHPGFLWFSALAPNLAGWGHESLPASHPNVELPGCLIRQPVWLKAPLEMCIQVFPGLL